MMKKRDIALSIVLYFLTCGIYSIYWYIVLTDEINCVTDTKNDTSGGIAFLLNMITCGIYGYYWMYKNGNKLDNLAVKNGQPSESRAIVYLILSLFGLSIIAYALMQSSLNKHVDDTMVA